MVHPERFERPTPLIRSQVLYPAELRVRLMRIVLIEQCFGKGLRAGLQATLLPK